MNLASSGKAAGELHRSFALLRMTKRNYSAAEV
jgi:hypothetical protein